MKSLSGNEFIKLLERNGWKLARIRGSHHIYVKDGRTERISVPIQSSRRAEFHGLARGSSEA
jgi:predicted RNA binding protein YcfA (HicA-like mRNA interferase family)